VVQATPDWSAEHLERTPSKVAPELVAALGAALGVTLPFVAYLAAHRWRYARTSAAGGPGALWDGALGLGACGDWLLAPRVEAAWLSGQQLAAAIG
jgi:renalase